MHAHSSLKLGMSFLEEATSSESLSFGDKTISLFNSLNFIRWLRVVFSSNNNDSKKSDEIQATYFLRQP